MLKKTVFKLARSHYKLWFNPRATYIRGFWPEPLTQQTLDEFLHDINYFEEPRALVNIGLKQNESLKRVQSRATRLNSSALKEAEFVDADKIVDLLKQDPKVPELDYDDVRIEGEALVRLAFSAGIYRDLFGKYVPDREHIRITRSQAERLDKMIPHFWITDQPFARVDDIVKKPCPLSYFEPLVGISAKFINQVGTSVEDLYAHTSYCGNFIPAQEALHKPSITLDLEKLSSSATGTLQSESRHDDWTPGQLSITNAQHDSNKHLSVALVNLDHLHEDAANLHWLIANIKPCGSGVVKDYQEVCEYLPVHGIRGFGYSRYVFVVFQHDSTIDLDSSQFQGFSLESRKFDMNMFIGKFKQVNLVPVGLSWFQTAWDESSNGIFHRYLQQQAPVYEHVQTKPDARPVRPYPGKVPFNTLLDHEANKKDINERVLLERLKSVDPTDYKDQYVPPRVPPTVFKEEGLPSWMDTVMIKKKNKIGYWRGLRPASVLLPLDNNADLDTPIRPIASSRITPPGFPNLYPKPYRHSKFKPSPTSKPANEHVSAYVYENYDIDLEKVKRMMEEFPSVETKSTSK